MMGFSFGGDPFWRAVRSNPGFVHEIYDFDCNPASWGDSDPGRIIDSNAAKIAARGEPCRARIVWGWNFPQATAAGYKTYLDGQKRAGLAVSVHPPSETFWAYPPKSGGSPWWDHALTNFPRPLDTTPARTKWMTQDVRHQFVVFGGEERTPTLSFSRPHATTFFRQFINASSFP